MQLLEYDLHYRFFVKLRLDDECLLYFLLVSLIGMFCHLFSVVMIC